MCGSIADARLPGQVMRTLRALGDLHAKRVLVRVDFNVPLDHGTVVDDQGVTRPAPAPRFSRTPAALPSDDGDLTGWGL